jgi:hypothetical protein
MHQRLYEFSFVIPKRLLQQYLPISDIGLTVLVRPHTSRVFSTSPNMMPLSVAQLPFPLGPASIDDHHLEHGGGPYRYPGNMTLR